MARRIRELLLRLRPNILSGQETIRWDHCQKNPRDKVDLILCKSIKDATRELMGEAIPTPQRVNEGLCAHVSDNVIYDTRVGSLAEKEDIEIRRLVSVLEIEDEDIVNRELKEFESGDLNIEHCWFEYNGRHFDAEVPSGVDDVNDLPIFKRLDVNLKYDS